MIFSCSPRRYAPGGDSRRGHRAARSRDMVSSSAAFGQEPQGAANGPPRVLQRPRGPWAPDEFTDSGSGAGLPTPPESRPDVSSAPRGPWAPYEFTLSKHTPDARRPVGRALGRGQEPAPTRALSGDPRPTKPNKFERSARCAMGVDGPVGDTARRHCSRAPVVSRPGNALGIKAQRPGC